MIAPLYPRSIIPQCLAVSCSALLFSGCSIPGSGNKEKNLDVLDRIIEERFATSEGIDDIAHVDVVRKSKDSNSFVPLELKNTSDSKIEDKHEDETFGIDISDNSVFITIKIDEEMVNTPVEDILDDLAIQVSFFEGTETCFKQWIYQGNQHTCRVVCWGGMTAQC